MGKFVEENDVKIYLEEYFPEVEAEKVPLVILSHGFNGSGDDFKRECKLLVEHGIACICFDFCGGSKNSRSSGKMTEMTLLTEKANLETVLDYAKTLENVDENRIFLFGGSQGGLVSALVAEEREAELAGLMLMYPALCIPDDWQKRFPVGSEIPDTIELWGVSLGSVFPKTLQGWDVWEKIGAFQKPVMIMHGDKDEIVAIEYAKKAANKYPNAYYEEFAGEGHGFSEKGMDKVVAMIKAFVKAD